MRRPSLPLQVPDLKMVVDRKEKLLAPVLKVDKGEKGDRGEAGLRGPSGLDVSEARPLWFSVGLTKPGHRSPHCGTPGHPRSSRRERIQR